MVRRLTHDLPNFRYKVGGDLRMKEVRHRVNENATRLPPRTRQTKCCSIEAKRSSPNPSVSALPGEALILACTHCLKPGCHPHCVAIRAARRNDCASGDWIPSGIGPFNGGTCHGSKTHVRLTADILAQHSTISGPDRVRSQTPTNTDVGDVGQLRVQCPAQVSCPGI